MNEKQLTLKSAADSARYVTAICFGKPGHSARFISEEYFTKFVLIAIALLDDAEHAERTGIMARNRRRTKKGPK